MTAIETTATVQPNGRLVLEHPDLKPGAQVKVIVLLTDSGIAALAGQAPTTGRKLKQDWAGGLSDLAKDFTSVSLQHKAREWWGD